MGALLAAIAVLLLPGTPYADEQRRLTGVLPAGWTQQGAIVFAGDLALGSFAVPANRRHSSCTARAQRALPADGAYVHILEYGVWTRGPRPSAGVGRGRPPARAVLRRPVEDFKCFGPSRMVRWRESGRHFQAHFYLGPRADAGVRDELAVAFDSLRFRE